MADACPKCGQESEAIFCPACGEMMGPRELDAFALLGVEARPRLDPEALKEAYRRLSLRLHPDHAPPGRREDALAWSSQLNRAYATLREPRTRLPCLLSSEAGGGADPMAPGAAAVDREMMELSLEVQRVCQAFDAFAAGRKSPLAAAEAAMEGRWGEERSKLEELRRKLSERRERLEADLETLDRAWREGSPPHTPLHKELRRLAAWFSYLSKFETMVGERLLAIRSLGL